MLCFTCGNEIDDGAAECQVCVANAERGSLAEEVAEVERCASCREALDECTCTRDFNWILCPNCGNQMEAGAECGVCVERRSRQVRAQHDAERHLCMSCGNEVYGKDPCPVCTSGRAFRKKRDGEQTMCRGCGNMVDDPDQCPICDGRPKKRRRHASPTCPGCEIDLVEQDWDGARVLMCEDCNGCFFLGDGLEVTLDKLRADAETDLGSVFEEFRDRAPLRLPKQVRYKPCPVCSSSMTRRNYKQVSGVIVDQCTHGTWTEQAAFGELSDWVSLGGDQLARSKRRR